MTLPWHNMALSTLHNDETVADSIKNNAEQSLPLPEQKMKD